MSSPEPTPPESVAELLRRMSETAPPIAEGLDRMRQSILRELNRTPFTIGSDFRLRFTDGGVVGRPEAFLARHLTDEEIYTGEISFHRETPPPRFEPTAEQRATIIAVRDRWEHAATTTEPADRDAAERAVHRLYAHHGWDRPRIVWVASPLAGRIATYAYAAAGKVADRLLLHQARRADWPGTVSQRGAITDLLMPRLRSIVDGQFWSPIADALYRLGTWNHRQVPHETAHAIVEGLRGQISSIGERPASLVWQDLMAWQESNGWAAHGGLATTPHAHTLALHEAYAAVHGGDIAPAVAVRAELTRHVGGWSPRPGVAILSDRPTTVHRDNQGRPHQADGPAVTWGDGVAVHAWHGVIVPADLVTGDGWTTRQIMASDRDWPIRRAAVERRGWHRVVAEANLAQVGDTVPDPGNPGSTLALHAVPSSLLGEDMGVVLCTNGSPDRDGSRRQFGITVPRRFIPGMRAPWDWIPADEAIHEHAPVPAPVAAMAWTYGLNPAQYAGLTRRT